ncbi:MAG: pro-sigmaK processing inhibitor BofA family protein [Oscillospiraceae bacterium]|nr:pro-sigmaK processing inhibitor BofA family protein [Oscillospiraceae bacterium]
MKNALLILFSVFGAIILFYAAKKLKFRYVLLSALSGLAALFAADFVCSFFDMNLPINAFSVSVSAIGGIPGVILLNILNVLLA